MDGDAPACSARPATCPEMTNRRHGFKEWYLQPYDVTDTTLQLVLNRHIKNLNFHPLDVVSR